MRAPAARIKELLRVFNYIAAPFGSEEWYFRFSCIGVWWQGGKSVWAEC
jgi:hypothetical protein